jgi:hypothetical protein
LVSSRSGACTTISIARAGAAELQTAVPTILESAMGRHEKLMLSLFLLATVSAAPAAALIAVILAK